MSIPTAHYIRYSSEDQIRGISLEAQVNRLKAESSSAKETVVAMYVDQARSGTKAANRQDLQAMLTAARNGMFQRIRIESVDRGHRNDSERRAFEAEMTSLGIEVVYCGEPLKQSPDQRKFQRGLRGLIAELESDTLSQRVYDRQLSRAKKGMWRGGPRPYGVMPDGNGWFVPDPDCFEYLLWILERRAEGQSYHAIAKQLNIGISLHGEPSHRPHTPGMLAYLRKPYLERQDTETYDIIQVERKPPADVWSKTTIDRICQEVDGVYGGILVWGKRNKRFTEDRYGNPKEVVTVQAHPPLIPQSLLDRVRVVQRGLTLGNPSTMSSHHQYLLDLYCGDCGHKMHGYSGTSYKPSGKTYKYQKYRCGGRTNRPGACTMTSLVSRKVEIATIGALLDHIRGCTGSAMDEAIVAMIEQYRGELVMTLDTLDHQRTIKKEEQAGIIQSIVRTSSMVVQRAMEEHVESLAAELARIDEQEITVRAGLAVLDTQARSVAGMIADPLLFGDIESDATRLALKRVCKLLIERAELHRISSESFCVQLQVRSLDGVLGCQSGTGGGG